MDLSTATNDQLVTEVQRLHARIAELEQTPGQQASWVDTESSSIITMQPESMQRLRATFEQSPIGIAHVGIDGQWLSVNERLCIITGYTREELFARRFQDITYPDDLAPDLANVERLLAGDIDRYKLEKRYIRKDGSIVWINLVGALMRDAMGAPAYFIATIEDITERKHTEMALRESEERFRKTFQASPVAKIITTQVDGRYLDVNASFERLFGWHRDELIGRPSTATSIWLDPSERDVMIAELRAHGRIQDRDMQVRTKAGVLRDVLVSVVPIIIDQQPCLLSTMIDITERKQMEQAIHGARQRLQILSQHLLEAHERERRHLARELHDQIGQMLTALKINLHMLRPPEHASVYAQRIQESVAIVDDLLQQVRALSLDLRPPMLDDLGLGAALEWYVDRVAKRTGMAALVENELGDHVVPPTIATACFRVAQEALTNVIRHAKAEHLLLTVAAQDGLLILTVQDDGAGFDTAAARARSSAGGSMGLLSMGERVELVGGHIHIDSDIDQGTTVRAWFPLSPLNTEPSEQHAQEIP